jgi:hypothetical protein
VLLVELLHSTNPAVLLAAAQALLELAKVRWGAWRVAHMRGCLWGGWLLAGLTDAVHTEAQAVSCSGGMLSMQSR